MPAKRQPMRYPRRQPRMPPMNRTMNKVIDGAVTLGVVAIGANVVGSLLKK